MKPLHSEEEMRPSYSKCYEEEEVSGDEIEDDDEEEEIDSEEDNQDVEYNNRENKLVENLVPSNKSFSQNGSTSSRTLGLYSSFDNIVGGSFNDVNAEKSYYDSSPKLDEQLISSHLKGTLSFGLPSKGNTLRIHRPYKIINKRKKCNLPRPKKPSTPRGGLLVHRPAYTTKIELLKKVEKEMERDNIEHLDEDLKVAYRIIMELMGDSLKTYNSIFMETIELDPAINGDYLDVVKEPVWLPRIKDKLLSGEYKSITEVVSQIRLMLENTYRYFGANHSFSKRGIRLEYILEQKIALFPREMRNHCSLEVTHNVTESEMKEATRTKSSSITVNGEQYFSYLLCKVKGCRQAREKDIKKKRLDLMRQAKVTKENEVILWDEKLTQGPFGGSVKFMWELVQINQFFYLSANVLNISEVSQYEMERILMIPEASMTLRMLMTSLVSSKQQRAKLSDKPYMPYNVWVRRLANKTFHWYRVYSRESRNSDKIFEQLGIEPKFWLVCGQQNPFSKTLFHELTLYQRVWMLKTLCDYVAHTHKSVQEAIAEQPEENMREILLGTDSSGNEYIHFPQFSSSDVRIYRRFRETQNSICDSEFDKQKEGKGSLFSKDQIKSFRKLIKKLKRNREKDEDWEYEARKLKQRLPKKRGRKPHILTSYSVTPPERRTRPERLRQTPKPRYNLLSLESCLDESLDDDEDYMKYAFFNKKKKKEIDSDSEEEEEEEEEEEKKVEANEEEEKEKVTEHTDSKPEETVDIPVKKKKINKEKHVCKTCGKSFGSKSAMYGHTAMHVRKKDKKPEEDEDEKMESLDIKDEKDDVIKSSTVTKYEEIEVKTAIKNVEKLDTENLSTPVAENIQHALEDSKFEQHSNISSEVPPGTNGGKESPVESKNELENVSPVIKKENQFENKDSLSNTQSDDNYKNNEEKYEDEKNFDKKDIKKKEEFTNNIDDVKENLSIKSLHKMEDDPSRSASPDDIQDNESSVGVPVEPESSNSLEPDAKEFELVAASFTELRILIQKFGALPPKYAREKKVLQEGEENEENTEDEENNETKENDKMDAETQYPKCEQKLHRALCKLLIQIAPSEGKMNAYHRQLRKKLWNEYLDWSKREPSYVDPAEEAWKSDPDPDPTPSATQTPKQSSSSSSSEESYNDDGTRKRKLRKRKVKRVPIDPPSPSATSDTRPPTPVNVPDEDTIAVSSRGRVRKVKRIVNYDRLDFDKLAQQAEKEAEKEKEKRKKKREEEAGREKALQEAAQSLHIPSSGVRRYIISKDGEVVGYIGNDGQVHSGNVKDREQQQQQQQQEVKQQQQPQQQQEEEHKLEPSEVDRTPKLVVSAWNETGTHVYVRMVGNQAIELMKLIDGAKNDTPRQIKLQRHLQTYSFSSNSFVMTQNIPGHPDSDLSNPQLLSKISSPKNTSTPIKVTPKKVVATTQAVTSPVTPVCKSPNPVALAYQGLPSSTCNLQSPPKPPQSTTCASLSASTRLVFASPSAVPSVSPIKTSSGVRYPLSSPTTPTTSSSPILVQTENGQQLQIGLPSDRLSQIVQKAGQRVIAVQNEKGRYTLSLVSSVNPQGAQVAKSTKVITSESQVLQGNSQKSVITQFLPTVVNAGGTGQQPISLIKGRLPQSSATVVSAHQQTLPQYTMNSQVINSPPLIGRPVMFQHALAVSTPTSVVTSLPQQQLVIAQAPVMQQPQQQILHVQQQSPQKVVQVVHSGGNRHLVQMLQPGQVLVSGNSINSSVSSVQQQPPTGVVVHPTQGIQCTKQPSILQPQVLVQQSPQSLQPKVVQVAHADQFTQHNVQHPVQFLSDQTQTKQIVIQSPQHYIVQQQHQQQQIQPVTQAHEPEQPLTQPLLTSPPKLNQNHLMQARETQQIQVQVQQGGQPKEGAKQVGRIVLLQMNDGQGQKLFLQLPDGRLSTLTPEQLQPLISSGAIKFNS